MIKMLSLTKLLQQAGFENIQTYLQSGNVLFNSDMPDRREVSILIEKRIKTELDLDVPVLVFGEKELIAAKDNNPYADGTKDESALYVTFLESRADETLIEKIEKEKYLPDEFSVEADLVYLYCPAGYGKTKLNNNFFENKLKLTATTRNWNTVCKLVELAATI